MHHLSLLDITGISMKCLQLRILLIKLICPCSLKIDSIHDTRNGIGIQLTDHAWNHTIGLFATPLIDMLNRSRRSEIKILHTSLIIILHNSSECILELILFVECNIIGDIHSCLLIQTICLLKHHFIKSIQIFHRNALTTYSLQNFLTSLSISSVCQHTHQIRNTHWGNHLRIKTWNFMEEIEGEAIVLIYNTTLFIRQDKISLIHSFLTFSSFHTLRSFHFTLNFLTRATRNHCHRQSHCGDSHYTFFHNLSNLIIIRYKHVSPSKEPSWRFLREDNRL